MRWRASVALARALGRDLGVRPAEHLDPAGEFAKSAFSPLAPPPTLADDARGGCCEAEQHLSRGISYAVRPALVAQSQRVAQRLLDGVEAQDRKLELVREQFRDGRLAGSRRPGYNDTQFHGPDDAAVDPNEEARLRWRQPV